MKTLHNPKLKLLLVAAMVLALFTGMTFASAADDATYVAFSSDVHYNTSNDTNNLEDWLISAKKIAPKLDSMSFCGDLGSAYCSTAANYWSFSQAVMDTAEAFVGSYIEKEPVYTFGNHEWYPSAGGDYANNKDNATAQAYINHAEAIRTDEYIVYAYGADGADQEYTDEHIAELENYLASCPTDIPVFVLVHFPVHYFSSRTCANAEAMIEMLNNYPNVFLIWGHNHNVSDTNYDHFQVAGDQVEIAPGNFVDINFTYCSAGCMSDAEYATGSAFVKGKGLIVKLEGLKVTMNYYDMRGNQIGDTCTVTIDPKGVNKDGPFTVKFKDGFGNVISEQTVNKGEDAAAPKEIPVPAGYRFTGWNKEFTNVTKNMTVTPVTEQLDMNAQITAPLDKLDASYIYFNVEKDGQPVTDRDGNPVIMYKVPYTAGMTLGDAEIALHEAAYPTGKDGITVADFSGYSCMTKLWGVDYENGAYGYINNTVTVCSEPVSGGTVVDISVYSGTKYGSSSVLPSSTTTVAGKAITLQAITTYLDMNAFAYVTAPFEGDVYAGKDMASLADTGVDANVMGYFTVSFDEPGDYYVLVKPHDNATYNAALGMVHVTEGTGKTVYFNVAIDDYVCTDNNGSYIAHYPVVLDATDNLSDAILQLHGKALNNNGKWTAVYSASEGCVINTQVWGIINVASSCGMGATYVNEENTPVTDLTRIPADGDIITLHGFTSSGYTAWRACMFDTKYAEIGVNEKITLTAGRIGSNTPSGSTGYGPIKPTTSDILVNFKTTDYKTDSNGAVTLSFDEEGTYIVTLKSGTSWSSAIAVIKVGEGGSTIDKETAEETAPVVVRSNQTITVDGTPVELDVYNINGNNYFKLRDIAMKLNGTDSTFGVGYDNATRTITCTIGDAYEANGSELVIGEDLSATAVKSNQPLYIDGVLSTIKAFNIGGNNFFQLRELGTALDFGVDYDDATRTVLINTDKPEKMNYKLSVQVATSAGMYEIPGDNEYTAWETTSDTSFQSGPMGYNNGNGFMYSFSATGFPTSYSAGGADWPVINIGRDYVNDYLTIHLELDEGSTTNKHAIIDLNEEYMGQEEAVVYLGLRAKSGNPFYFYKVTITPTPAEE